MKRNWRNNTIVLAVLVLLLLVSACNNGGEHAEHADTYTCPMHPSVVSDRPSTCPVCGMDLVRKARPGEEVQITEDLARLLKSPNETVVASIKTIKGEYKKMGVSVEAQGVVTYDTRNIYTIPARIGGRLERVYLKYAFQQVKKGQKVAEIYSPELLTAQRELLFLLENDPDNQTLLAGAKEKLSLLGATASQIEELSKRKDVQNTFAIYSPYNGYIIVEGSNAPTAPVVSAPTSSSGGGMSDGMGGNSSPASSMGNNTMASAGTEGTIIREGSYVASGQTLFKVVNTSALRVELNIPSSQAASIKKGTIVDLDFGDGRKEAATVDFVQPFFNEGEEFVTVRVYTKKADNLHIGHLVRAMITGDSSEALWIPKQAILDLGLEKVVFVREKEVFKPKKVTVGLQSDNAVEVKQGLSSTDEIASNAQYLVDSESFIKTLK